MRDRVTGPQARAIFVPHTLRGHGLLHQAVYDSVATLRTCDDTFLHGELATLCPVSIPRLTRRKMALERALLASKTGDEVALQQLHLSGALHDGVADEFGATCVHHAARTGQLSSLKYLVQTARLSSAKKAKNGASPAHDAAATGQLPCLQWLLKFSGCNVRDRDTSGATVLHLAARFGHLPVLQWLVTEGCDLQDTAGHGVTALHFAAANGDVECLKYLLKQAPSLVNAPADNGTTPVYFAIQEGHLSCAEHLVTGGANVHHQAGDGMRPVHAAAQMGHLNILIWLVNDQDALPTERDNDGATPIHFASSRGHAKVVSWLLLHGGKCEKDNLGGTPMHDAAEHGQLECLKVLVEAGEDVHGQDHDGFTPADLAEECGHTVCAKYLRTVMKEKPRRLSAPSIAKQPQRRRESMRENTKPVHGEPVRASALVGVSEENDSPEHVYQNDDNGEYEDVLVPPRDKPAPTQLVTADVHSGRKKDSGEHQEPYPPIPPPDYDMDDQPPPVDRDAQPVFIPPPPPDKPPPAIPERKYSEEEKKKQVGFAM
ncbi:PREDICTED: espin-like [Branchiostoma belcheri]|uniref:Espin-like n=1 Tax=Branchiostoma belcheri TaxID=7741 RepID=A0A6P5AY31_BRABE|nr:PREDICTED: espin-like [Branchiostoma belcheri]